MSVVHHSLNSIANIAFLKCLGKPREYVYQELVYAVNQTKNLSLSIYITLNDHICYLIHPKLIFYYYFKKLYF